MISTSIVNYFIRPPEEFLLSQNYPNPFNPNTKIRFTVPVGKNKNAPYKPLDASLKVYNILGEEIAVLVSGTIRPGTYEIDFNAVKYNLASGVYYYVMTLSNGYLESKKMIFAE